MKLKQIFEDVQNDNQYYRMGYVAFQSNLEDIPGIDPTFSNAIKTLQSQFKGNIKTLGFLVKNAKQQWYNGYKQASKDAGNKPFRMKGSSQSSAAYLLKNLKRIRNKNIE